MLMRHLVLTPILLAAAFPATVHGAEPTSGPRVRVTSAGNKRVVGTLVALDDQFLRLTVDEDKEVRLQRAAVTMLEVSQRRGTRGKWILRGVLVGGAIGAGIGKATETDCPPPPEDPNDDLFAAWGGGLCESFKGTNVTGGAILGAAAGALLGLRCLSRRKMADELHRCRPREREPIPGRRGPESQPPLLNLYSLTSARCTSSLKGIRERHGSARCAQSRVNLFRCLDQVRHQPLRLALECSNADQVVQLSRGHGPTRSRTLAAERRPEPRTSRRVTVANATGPASEPSD